MVPPPSPAQKGTPAMKDDVAKVAEGLTKAQREALLLSVPLSGPTSDHYLHTDCDDEVARQLYLDGCVTFRDRLTPFGLAVRANLENRNVEG